MGGQGIRGMLDIMGDLRGCVCCSLKVGFGYSMLGALGLDFWLNLG